MTKRNKNLVGVIFIGVILSVLLYFMKDGVKDGALSDVIPIAFLALVSISIAAIASFLFNMVENTLSVEHPLSNGKLSLGGGAAVFFLTLVTTLYAAGYLFNNQEGAQAELGSTVDFSVPPNAYLSTYEDGRTAGLTQADAQAKLTKAFDSSVALELVLSFADLAQTPQGFDVDSIRADLKLFTATGTRIEPISWVCKGGSRDLDNLRNPDRDWQNCPKPAAKFTVGTDVVSEDYLFRAQNYSWKTFLSDMINTSMPQSEIVLMVEVSERGQPETKIALKKRCFFSNNDLKFFLPTVDGSNSERRQPQFGIPVKVSCQE